MEMLTKHLTNLLGFLMTLITDMGKRTKVTTFSVYVNNVKRHGGFKSLEEAERYARKYDYTRDEVVIEIEHP